MAEWTAEKRRLKCQRDLMAKRQPEKKAKMPKENGWLNGQPKKRLKCPRMDG